MEEKKTLLFIFNPFSGKAQIKNQLMDIVDTMVKAGYEVTIYPTQAPEDAIHKVEVDAEKYDLVVCSGGDGTLDEVVSGIMHKGLTVPLGYIPAGSTNDCNITGNPERYGQSSRCSGEWKNISL